MSDISASADYMTALTDLQLIPVQGLLPDGGFG